MKKVARSANTTLAERRGRAREGALRRAGVREAAGGGGFLPGGRRRGSGGRDPGQIAIGANKINGVGLI